MEDLTVDVTKMRRSWTKFLLGAVSCSGSGADWESISHYPEVGPLQLRRKPPGGESGR